MSCPDDVRRVSHHHEDTVPIAVQWKPGRSPMQGWTKMVDLFLREKAVINRRKARQAQQANGRDNAADVCSAGGPMTLGTGNPAAGAVPSLGREAWQQLHIDAEKRRDS